MTTITEDVAATSEEIAPATENGAAKGDFSAEVAEWVEAFDEVVAIGRPQAVELLEALRLRGRETGVVLPYRLSTRFRNTIPPEEELPYPGDMEMERRIKSLIRWNAMAMVHGQNKKDPGIGGHISTYASLATLLEVGYSHFFHAKYTGEEGNDLPGDFIYFQGHASPGVYARAYLEGRLTDEHLKNFRHELRGTPGLSSYPHPWLMPDFWNFPTVSMGLGPINAIYQARFMRYLENRGLIERTPRKIWAFVGDGETDEVETLGAISLGAREKLDNLIFVVNCNLQRLDGPVRGNKRIIDELEGVFTGAGWNVIKVIWGRGWDELFARDMNGLLLKRMEECVDGDFQTYKAKGGAYLRTAFFGKYPELLEMVKDYTDDELIHLQRGGHDPVKVFNAYKRAVEHRGVPSVVLAMTVKGYGMGPAESRNATHSEKKLSDEGLAAFVKRFNIPIPEEAAIEGTPYRPPQDSPEMVYMQERRRELGGVMPTRSVAGGGLQGAGAGLFQRVDGGIEWARRVDDDGIYLGAAAPAEEPGDRQAGGADRSGRGTDVWDGVGDPAGGDLRAGGAAVHAARQGDAAVLPRRAGWTDSGGRDHRGGSDGFVHGCGAGLLDVQDADDSLLHVLLDVRVPADWGPGVGVCGRARTGVHDGRDGGADDHAGRGTAAPGRAQPRAGEHDSDLRELRSGVHVRDGGGAAGGHPADVREGRRVLLLHHDVQRGVRDAGDAGGRGGGDSEGDL